MEKVKAVIKELLYPPKWVYFSVCPIVFALMIYLRAADTSYGAPTYAVYALSAYCMTVIVVPLPKLISKAKKSVYNKIEGFEPTARYLHDMSLRGNVSIYQGLAVNFFYAVFCVYVGIRYASVWFVSMAAYYLVLGLLRLSLIISYRHREKYGELRPYRRTAWLLFLLNIPMGGMILLMIVTNSGASYPGYVIYLSAMYTFYTMAMSVVNLVKFRKLGSPILFAAKVLNFIAAMMSVLCLQTAMIAQFSANGEHFRITMNAMTGTAVWFAVIVTAVWMLIRYRKIKGEVNSLDQIRK